MAPVPSKTTGQNLTFYYFESHFEDARLGYVHQYTGVWPMAYGAPSGGTLALRGSAVPLARGTCRLGGLICSRPVPST
eukprot:25907-Prymnesium_polylepis.1